jgi:hypothetical protein
MWWTVLFLSGCLRAIMSFGHGWLVHAFVHSKPPGRKMVNEKYKLQAGAELCQAQFKLELAKPSLFSFLKN